jgi:glycosyltransferase involved in cell wall biosynthesis
MKVALAWNARGSGAEQAIVARREIPLLQRLAARGVKATVLLLGEHARLAAALRDAGIDVHSVPIALPPSAVGLRALPAAVFHVRRLLARLEPDVVEGDDVMPAIAAGLAAGRRRRSVVVFRRHHSGGRRRLYVASRIAARLADRTLVSSEAMRRRAGIDDGVPLDRIDVATSGTMERRSVSAEEILATRRSIGVAAHGRVVAVVSQLRREKGIDVLLAALSHVRTPDVTVAVVGAGPEGAALRRLAAASPARVEFVGHQDDVDRWIAAADVIAMPSRDESFGRVTLEAMAMGRPLVASRVGGLVEAVVDGVTGLLVEPGEPVSLGTTLDALLADPARAREMGIAARARYEANYTITHMADAWHRAWIHGLSAARGAYA